MSGFDMACHGAAVMATFELLDMMFESKRSHGRKKIFAIDGLPFLLLTLERGLRSDKGYELGSTFLHGIFGFLGDLGIGREDFTHDFAHIGYRQQQPLLAR